jgi:hypothetical protein
MNKQKWIVLVAALVLMGGTAVLLKRSQAHQHLGRPPVKTSQIEGSPRLRVELPSEVPGYTSEALEQDKTTLQTLPQDTSFGMRRYTSADGSWTLASVVLMGRDRTSIHKTEYCMQGTGWHIDRERSGPVKIRVDRPYPYDLPAMKYIVSREMEVNGQKQQVQGIYIAWFVADNDEFTADHWQRMWWLARDMMMTGVLQRWALVSYLSVCMPGQEEPTFERMKQLVARTAPEFLLVPRPKGTTVTSLP